MQEFTQFSLCVLRFSFCELRFSRLLDRYFPHPIIIICTITNYYSSICIYISTIDVVVHTHTHIEKIKRLFNLLFIYEFIIHINIETLIYNKSLILIGLNTHLYTYVGFIKVLYI